MRGKVNRTVRGGATALLLAMGVTAAGAAGEGGLRVSCPDESGDVFIDGKQKGECQFPLDMKLSEGKYLLTIRRDLPDGSFRIFEKPVFVGADTKQQVEAGKFETQYTEEYYWARKEYEKLLKVYPKGAHAAESRRIIDERRVAVEKKAREEQARQAKAAADKAAKEKAEKERQANAEKKARADAREKRDAALKRRLDTIDSIWADMAPVKGGCFKMGDVFGDGEKDERPVHEVCLSDFRIGRHEVTAARFDAVMGTGASSNACPDCPVSGLNYFDALRFVAALNARTGGSYRLPTEAQWEFAARSGGKEEKFPGGVSAEEVGTIARFAENSQMNGRPEVWIGPVGQRKPNGLGLFDMAGNVREWVSDIYDFKPGFLSNDTYYKESPKNDPTGPLKGAAHILRGGDISARAHHLRTTMRQTLPASGRVLTNGIRLAASAGGPVPVAKLLDSDDPTAKERKARLAKLKELLDAGLISKEEHDLKVEEAQE